MLNISLKIRLCKLLFKFIKITFNENKDYFIL